MTESAENQVSNDELVGENSIKPEILSDTASELSTDTPTKLQSDQDFPPTPKMVSLSRVKFYGSLAAAMMLGSVLTLGILGGFYYWKQQKLRVDRNPNSEIRLGILPSPSTPVQITIPTPPNSPIPNSQVTPIPNNSKPSLKLPVVKQVATQTPANSERIYFEVGSTGTSINNTLKDNQSKRYILGCRQGQQMTILLQEGNINLVIIGPDGQQVESPITLGKKWQTKLQKTGDYGLDVTPVTPSDPQKSFGNLEYKILVEVL